jgi:hypothetical protein
MIFHNMQSSIRVYGEQAQSIRNGEKFVARITSVEGRRVVILEAARASSVRGEPL